MQTDVHNDGQKGITGNKKYAALREGLTEVIAIPTYLTCGALAGKGAALFKDPAKSEIAKHNLRFAGVCAAALFVIPGLCSLVIKPFTDKILGKQPDKKPNTKNLDITSKVEEPALKIQLQQPEKSENFRCNNLLAFQLLQIQE